MKLQEQVVILAYILHMQNLASLEYVGAKRKLSYGQWRVIERIGDRERERKEKVKRAWRACRILHCADTSCSGDDLNPDFRATVKQVGDSLLPSVLVDMIIKYCVTDKLRVTEQRWNLAQLWRSLNGQTCDDPFGLVKVSKDYLWIAAKDEFGRQTFKVPLDGGDVSYSRGLLHIHEYTRCGPGVLAQQDGVKLISLEDGETLADCESSNGEWSVGRLYALNAGWMVAHLLFAHQGNCFDKFVINRKTGVRVGLKREFFGDPDNVTLCQPKHAKTPWVLAFYRTLNDGSTPSQRFLEIFEALKGDSVGKVENPGRLLHVSDDQGSMACIVNALHAGGVKSFITYYAIPSGKIISQTMLTTPILDDEPKKGSTFVMNAFRNEYQSKDWHQRIFLGVHPAYGRSVVLASNMEELYVRQNIADEEGSSLAAIVDSRPARDQHLVVWNVELQ